MAINVRKIVRGITKATMLPFMTLIPSIITIRTINTLSIRLAIKSLMELFTSSAR